LSEGFKRADRVADRILHEISDLIIRKLNDPRVGFVTVTRVKCSDDLRNATVYFSIFGDEAKKAESMAGLKSALPFFQKEVFKRLQIKVPTLLYFRLDEGLEQGHKIQKLLKEIRDEREGAHDAQSAPGSD
jgi:ribosome-binding factor A